MKTSLVTAINSLFCTEALYGIVDWECITKFRKVMPCLLLKDILVQYPLKVLATSTTLHMMTQEAAQCSQLHDVTYVAFLSSCCSDDRRVLYLPDLIFKSPSI